MEWKKGQFVITPEAKAALLSGIDAYVSVFCEKQDLELEFWVADIPGGIGCFNSDFYIDFDNIRLDIDTDQPKEEILEWYSTAVELATIEAEYVPTYYSWIKDKESAELRTNS